jgi:apolipoprotein N-acyltransferase
MVALHGQLAALTGWRRHFTAAAAGALAALGLPPFYAFPALVVSFTVLIWLIDGAARRPHRLRAAVAAGWWFGFSHFAAGLYWIANSFLVEADRFGWLAPFAVAGLALYLGLFPALAAGTAALAPAGLRRVLALAAAWAAAEWLRGVLLTGFPWNLMATAFAFSPALVQGAAWVGSYGLSFAVVLVAAAPATLGGAGARGPAARYLPVAAAALLLAVMAVAGAGRLGEMAGAEPAATAPRLRIVQANIDQRLKWRPELQRRHFEAHLALSGAFASRAGPAFVPDAVIWPEAAVPVSYDGDPRLLRVLARGAPPNGILITGVVRRTPPGRLPSEVWNSVIAITGEGAVAALYDKHHLVPFGEYVPLKGYNPFPKITRGRVDFSAGPGPRTVALPRLPAVSPLICYEAIFPGGVVARGAPPPRWLLNVTNDAWFGRSTGPYQHLAAARLRAVEEGLPLVRAANTGISAVIDARGRVLHRLPLGTRGVIDTVLPAPLERPTLYAGKGNLVFAILAMVALAAAGLGRRVKPS